MISLVSRLGSALVILVALGRGQAPPVQEAEPLTPSLAAAAREDALRARLAAPMAAIDPDLVMLGEDFFGAEPRAVRWSDTSEAIVFDWKRWDEKRRGTWVYDVNRRTLERRSDEQPGIPRGVWSRDRQRRAYREGQAVVVEDMGSREVREVLRVDRGFGEFLFAVDGQALLLQRDDGVFRLALDGPGLVQLLAIREGKPPKDEDEVGDVKKDLAAWHREQQRELFRVLREREERSREDRKARKAREAAEPKVPAYYVPEGFRVEDVAVSPAANFAAVVLSKPTRKPRVAELPDYVTADGYVRVQPTRPKAGDEGTERRMEIVALATGASVPVREPIPDLGATPWGPTWSPDGRFLLASAATRDDEQSFLLRVEPATGEVKVLHRLQDGAWVLQHGFGVEWLGDGPRVVFGSEASGWTQAWIADAETLETRQLTKGAFEVSSLRPTPDGRRIYAVATPTSPHVRDLVEIDPDTGDVVILTADGGGRSFALSPDGTMVAEVFSRGNRPWELRVRFLDGGREPVTVTDSPSPAFKSFPRWEEPPIVRFPASDGVQVPARIYRPAKPLPGHPAVIFVHGAGYLQEVHNWWSHYEREYAFDHLLRDEGYTVVAVDYRGSAGYGRAWRTAIRLHMGGRDLDDLVDAAHWLVDQEGVAPDRIGLYGGSYGGFLTLMALFTKPGVFRAGAALRPVTDWAHYADGYTSNILDTPLENPEAYARSSPIRFAEGLQDELLIGHGLLDDNVQVQDTFRLVQRLIELRKTGWEVACFPLENHGFRDAASWSDEYRRIKALFDRVLRR